MNAKLRLWFPATIVVLVALESCAGPSSHDDVGLVSGPLVIKSDCVSNGGTTYRVGPGGPPAYQYATVHEALSAALHPGDVICVYPGTYVEKFSINASGTAGAHISIRGITAGGAARPVIDGNNARDWIPAPDSVDPGAVVVITNNSFVDLENLEIKGALFGNAFTNSTGGAMTYQHKAMSVFVHTTDSVVLRNLLLDSSSLAVDSTADNTNTVIEGNYFVNLGTDLDPDRNQDSTYMEGIGTTYRFNRYGDYACTFCRGPMLKDRSINPVILSNLFDSNAGWSIDLVEKYEGLESAPGYPDGTGSAGTNAWIEGNVLVRSSSSPIDEHRLVHVGGDFYKCTAGLPCAAEPDKTWFRKNVAFYNNTVVTRDRRDDTRVLTLDSAMHADVRNNLFYANQDPDVSTGKHFTVAVTEEQGSPSAATAYFSNNEINSGDTSMYRDVDVGVTPSYGTADRYSASPGFASLANDDFHLTTSSVDPIDHGGAVDPNWPPVRYQYLDPSREAFRPSAAALDIGAYEFPAPPPKGVFYIAGANGAIVSQAEDFHAAGIGTDTNSWVTATAGLNGYEGTGFEKLSNTGAAYQSTVDLTKAHLDYQIYFPTTESFTLSLRQSTALRTSPRVHVTIDYGATATYLNVAPAACATFGCSTWDWANVSIASLPAGYHTISIWAADATAKVDMLELRHSGLGSIFDPDSPTAAYLENGGLVEINTAHYHSSARVLGVEWMPKHSSWDLGGVNVISSLRNGTVWTVSGGAPQLKFRVNFTNPGAHYVWLHADKSGTPGTSLHAHFSVDESLAPDGNAVGVIQNGVIGAGGWGQMSAATGRPAELDVESGYHTVDLFMDDDFLIPDAFILTTDPNYSPSNWVESSHD